MARKLIERELTSEGPRLGSGGAGKRRTVTVNAAESPLAWLHSRGHLDDRLFDAGEALAGGFRAEGRPDVKHNEREEDEEQRGEAARDTRPAAGRSSRGGAGRLRHGGGRGESA